MSGLVTLVGTYNKIHRPKTKYCKNIWMGCSHTVLGTESPHFPSHQLSVADDWNIGNLNLGYWHQLDSLVVNPTCLTFPVNVGGGDFANFHIQGIATGLIFIIELSSSDAQNSSKYKLIYSNHVNMDIHRTYGILMKEGDLWQETTVNSIDLFSIQNIISGQQLITPTGEVMEPVLWKRSRWAYFL